MIETEAERLARLIDDLLDLSRIQAGAVQPRTDWTDLHETVVSAIAQAQAIEGDHAIDYELPAELPLVKADPAQLERVFANLIQNAIKFSPPDSPVRVTGGVGFRLRHGSRHRPRPGHSPVAEVEHLRAVLQGQELERIRSRAGDRPGFVEANGGRVRMQTGTAEGTSFAVSFPLVAQPAAAV